MADILFRMKNKHHRHKESEEMNSAGLIVRGGAEARTWRRAAQLAVQVTLFRNFNEDGEGDDLLFITLSNDR